MRWQPSEKARVPFDGFDNMISGISKRSEVLGRYVHKYFEDCVHHFRSLGRVLRDGANAHYIVGNSKFYDEMVHTEEIYAALPPYKVERATVKEKVFYVYKDEKAGVAYVGHEPEDQRYKQLAVQQQIAQEQYMAAELDRQAALNFYGGFGVRRMWW